MQNEIIYTLKNIPYEFQENELAYLALTTKIELPFRDRWAYSLFKNLAHTNVNVSREWKRTDLALIQNSSPLALIELKAMYTFDALNQRQLAEFTNAMSTDEEKAKKLADKNTEIYTILLATHPTATVHSSLSKIVKYDSGINKAIKNLGTSDAVKEKAINKVNIELKDRNVVLYGEFSGGKAFGIDTSILYWLVKV